MTDVLSDAIQPKSIQRAITCYKALVSEGFANDVAAFLSAMSAYETNYLTLISRTDATVFVTAPCFGTSVRCALEADFNNLLLNGAAVTLPVTGSGPSGIVIDPQWYADSAGMKILQQSLQITQLQGYTLLDGVTVPWVHQITPPEWTQANQLGFEYALINRKLTYLRQWDMGPVNLRCMGMSAVATALGQPQLATNGFPATPEDMFTAYVSTSYADAFSNGAAWWLPPVYTGAYPQRNAPDQALLTQMAARQLGVTATSTNAANYAAQLQIMITQVAASDSVV